MARRRAALPSEPVTAEVHDLDSDGRGVARVDNKVVFIDGALAGETVRFVYRRRRGRFDEGAVTQVLRPAGGRVEARCAHFDACGGCSLQHLDHAEQVQAKQARLVNALENIGKVMPRELLPPLVAAPWGYRRKARLGVRYVLAKGGALVGFRERRSSRVAEIVRCEVLHPSVGGRIAALRALIGGLDARERIPQVEVAVGDDATALVFRTLDELGAADRSALVEFARASDLCVFLQPGGPDSVVALWPEDPPELVYRLDEHAIEFAFRPTDFTQVNAEINRALVARALELLAPAPEERVLDLFCGLGNFTLPLARRVAHVTGLEGEAALVERARENAARNAIANADFACVDLSDPEQLAPWLARPWDALLLDPPRSGAAAVVQALGPRRPRSIAYVSCNPATLARDLGELVRVHGYQLLCTGAVDMFPHTNHVESVALLRRA